MLTVRIPIANPETLLTTWGAGALARLESSATETGSYTEVGTAALVAGLYDYYVVDAAGTSAMWYRWRPSIAAPAVPEDYGSYSDPWVPGGPYLTVAQYRAFPGAPSATELPDEQLLILLDAAARAIVRAVGPLEDVREEFETVPGDLLMLSVRAESITSVAENARYLPLTLATDDYELSPSGRTLRRLSTGTHPIWNWWGRVVVTYQPADDTSERQRVQRQLVDLELSAHPGLAATTIGTWSETYRQGVPYAQQRADILASLSSNAMPI